MEIEHFVLGGERVPAADGKTFAVIEPAYCCKQRTWSGSEQRLSPSSRPATRANPSVTLALKLPLSPPCSSTGVGQRTRSSARPSRYRIPASQLPCANPSASAPSSLPGTSPSSSLRLESLVYRLDRSRLSHHAPLRKQYHAGIPRAWRQSRKRGFLRRGPGALYRILGLRRLRQLRPGLLRPLPHPRAAPHLRRICRTLLQAYRRASSRPTS